MTMHPDIGLHLIPEEADLGENAHMVHAGHSLDLIRFDHGMESGKAAVGVCVSLRSDRINREMLVEILDEHDNVWLTVETSLALLKASVDAIVAREEAEGRPIT